MLAKGFSATVIGVEGTVVEVEVDVSPGLPAFVVVGLADTDVQESRERVRAAIKNSGYPFPASRITANLAPADLRKEGSGFDLPIALGLLATQGVIPQDALAGALCAAELALDGTLRPIDGAINIALAAAQHGYGAVVLAPQNAQEAAVVDGVEVFTPTDLRQAVEHLSGRGRLEAASPAPTPDEAEMLPDLRDIKGQALGKRALEIALAGHHNLLRMWTLPGSVVVR